MPTTFYVDASAGDNGNIGSASSPWSSIQYAADRAQPGDTIYVRAGSYDPFEVNVSGTSDAQIKIAAYPGDENKVLIDGSGYSGRGLIEIRGESYITIEGFTLKNAPTDGIYVEGSVGGERGIEILNNVVDTTGNSGIYVCGQVMGQTIGVDEYRLFDVVIAGNEVTNTNYPNGGNEAISLGGGVDGFIITDNWVHDSQQYGIDAKFGAINGVISNNLIHDIEKHGIYLDSNSRTVANIEIFGNEIYGNNNGIALAREAAREPAEPNMYDIDIYDNVIYDNAKYGVMAYAHKADTGTGLFDDVQIFDNTITGNDVHGVHLKGIEDYATNFVVAGNTFSGNGKDILNEIGAVVDTTNKFTEK